MDKDMLIAILSMFSITVLSFIIISIVYKIKRK